MVDAERLHRILRAISDRVTRLQVYADQDKADLLDDEVRLIDDHQVVANLVHLDDLDDYVDALTQLLVDPDPWPGSTEM